MSFSTEVKNELLSAELESCCRHALSYAIILFGRTFSAKELAILTENNDIINAYCEAIHFLSGETVQPLNTDGKKRKVSVTDKKILSTVFEKLGFSESTIKRRVNFANLQEPCCLNAFLRGVFLACGTVTDPEKEYHLEFSVSSKGLCDDLIRLFEDCGPTPKVTQRSGTYTVYFKNSTDIEDVLAIIGATENSLVFMQTKILKDIRNTVNRKVNFESANIKRTIIAAAKQCDAIEKIQKNMGLDALPPELREIARLRLENREVSNSDIGKMLSESITVSGVNHRFQKIIKIAQELK